MATKVWFSGDSDSAYEPLIRWSSGNNDARLNGSASGWEALGVSGSLHYLDPRGVTSHLSRSVVADTVAGPTSGIEFGVTGGALPWRWISPPLAADVTIAGTITFNMWGVENNMSANAAINCALYKIDGATGAMTQIIKTARTTELPTTAAAQNFTGTPTSTACKKGDRIMAVPFIDDAGTMASGFTATFQYGSNATPNVTSDSWFEFTETFTFEETAPAGSTIYPTNTASDTGIGGTYLEAWTSRGAGVQSVGEPTSAGWADPLLWFGGALDDEPFVWLTKQLAAFTLGGPVLCNIRAAESNAAANVSVRVQLSVVDSDGVSNEVVWAVATSPLELGTSEAAQVFWLSGDDLAVADGRRIKIWVLGDDTATAPQASGNTRTLYWAGTTGGASGDTFLTFSQTLTEFVAGSFTPVDPMGMSGFFGQ